MNCLDLRGLRFARFIRNRTRTRTRWGSAALLAGLAAMLPLNGEGQAKPAARPLIASKTVQAAEHGSAKAQAYLGWLYSSGQGVPQSYERAAYWYYCSARQGYGNAQFALGLLYNKGHGVRRDYRMSYAWLSLSAAQPTGAEQDFKTRIRAAIALKLTYPDLYWAQELSQAGPGSPGLALKNPAGLIPFCPEAPL